MTDMTDVQISIDEGTLILIRQILRRTGRPNVSADEVMDEIMGAITELQNPGKDGDQ